MKYKVVQAKTPEDLEEKVEKLLNYGWDLQGGLAVRAEAVAPYAGRGTLMQAMLYPNNDTPQGLDV